MKASPAIVFAALLSLGDVLRAQTAPLPPQPDIQQWIGTTNAQWQAAYDRDVTDAFKAGFEKLRWQYSGALDAALAKAINAGDLDTAVAIRAERERFATSGVLPPKDGEKDPATVKQIRATTRQQILRLEQDAAARTKALHAQYDKVLEQAQTQLTQAGRLDDALLLKKNREAIAAKWLAGPTTAAAGLGQPAKRPSTTTGTGSGMQPPAGANLVKNGTFENGIDGWNLGTGTGGNSIAVDSTERHNGKPSLRITNAEPGRTAATQKIAVKPNTRYQISAWIKTRDVESDKSDAKNGACVGVAGGYKKSQNVSKTKAWALVTAEFVTGDEQEITFGPSLGWYHAHASGTAWFSDVRFIELGRNASK
jgi:hypothetical protein